MAGWGSPIANQNIKSTGKDKKKDDIYGCGDQLRREVIWSNDGDLIWCGGVSNWCNSISTVVTPHDRVSDE